MPFTLKNDTFNEEHENEIVECRIFKTLTPEGNTVLSRSTVRRIPNEAEASKSNKKQNDEVNDETFRLNALNHVNYYRNKHGVDPLTLNKDVRVHWIDGRTSV